MIDQLITHIRARIPFPDKDMEQVHPAGLENMFIAMSQPAEKPELPALPGGPPSSAFLQKLQQLQQVHGIEVIDNSKIITAS